MFGTATTGTSHDIRAVSGLWNDGDGAATALRIAGADPQHKLLKSAMLKDRKAVLIDRMGWDLQSPDGLHEIDQYDADDTLYLVVHQPHSVRHLGSVRLLPSVGPHLLGEIFPFLCADGVPIGPDVWEITRLVTAPGLRRHEALQVRRQLAIALFEHALEHGIRRYTMVTHMPWLAGLLTIGWDAEPLGMPHGEGDTAIAAMQILIKEDTLHRLRSAWALDAPVLPAGFSGQLQPSIGGVGKLAF